MVGVGADAGVVVPEKEIDARIAGYANPVDFYVDRLAEGIATITASVAPKPVIVRLSDFKSNEYANLIGGARYEPHEENPMIGFRGASRYIDPGFKDAFALECRAVKRVREDMGLDNLWVMIPFVRTLDEGRKVIEVLRDNGLVQGENGLKVIMMCELPSNALLADEFLDIFDGFSIGSNDMTQLTLGVDRDSGGPIAPTFDERDPSPLINYDGRVTGRWTGTWTANRASFTGTWQAISTDDAGKSTPKGSKVAVSLKATSVVPSNTTAKVTAGEACKSAVDKDACRAALIDKPSDPKASLPGWSTCSGFCSFAWLSR